MSDLRERILVETRAFRDALPALLPEYRGRWVVFKDGMVQSDHDTEEEAYLTGHARFGLKGGHIIAQVVEERPSPLTAGVVFGIAS